MSLFLLFRHLPGMTIEKAQGETMKTLSLLILCALFVRLPAQAALIQVTAPAAGASWKIGTTQSVQWSFSGIPATAKVHVLLWQNGSKLGKIADTLDIGANGQGS